MAASRPPSKKRTTPLTDQAVESLQLSNSAKEGSFLVLVAPSDPNLSGGTLDCPV